MVKQKICIRCTDGLHIRPCESIITYLTNLKSSVSIIKGEKEVNAKSVLSLLTLCIKKGDELTIIVVGENEKEDLSNFLDFLKQKRYF